MLNVFLWLEFAELGAVSLFGAPVKQDIKSYQGNG